MKKVLAVLATVSIVFLLASCQKESSIDTSSAANSEDRVKTYTEDITSPATGHSVTTFNVNYDASGKISSFVSASDPGDKVVYSYSANTVLSDLYVDGVWTIHNEAYLVNNHIDSTFEYNDSGDTTTSKYIYSPSGVYIRTYEYNYSRITGAVLQNTITYTYDSNGNQLTANDTDGNGEIYEYYADLNYVYPLIGPPLIPSVKRNLIKTHTITFYGDVLGTATFTYTFDSKNRISTEKGETDDGTVVIKTYTYY